MKSKKLLLSLLSALLSNLGFAQQLAPPIDNFKAFQYNAGSKNWDLAVNDRGELFVANNRGLLHFNGENWTLYRLPNSTVIRSVACIEGRIYTGSYEEFGYWEPNAQGSLEYTSLTSLISGHTFTSEEFWEIIAHRGEVVFRSFSAIYSYTGDRIRVIDPDEVVSDIISYNGKLIVALGYSGLFELSGDQLTPLTGEQSLEGKAITDMVAIPRGLLIGTKLHGCYLYSGGQSIPWGEAMTPELKLHQLNKLSYLNTGQVVFGTIKNGIYIFDPQTQSVQLLNRGVGLQNNTVLALLQYKDQLWVAEDNGIDRVRLNNPFTYYTDITGAVGTVYDLAFHKGTLYLGTNTGVFYFEDDQLEFIDGSQGHVWDLEIIEGELFCGHNTGTFLLNDGKLDRISSVSGGYQLVKIPEAASSYLQGTYVGITRFFKSHGQGWKVQPVEGFNRPVKFLCFEDDHVLWAAHAYKGLYRIQLNEDYSKITGIQEFGSESLPGNYNIKLYNVKNQIVIRSNGLWFKYDPIAGEIVPFEEFEPYSMMSLIHVGDGNYWFSGQDVLQEIILTDLKSTRLVLDDEPMRKRLAPEAENVIKLNDSIFYFTLSDGFGKFNLAKFRRNIAAFNLPKPFLAGISDKVGRYSLQDGRYDFSFAESRELWFRFASPDLPDPHFLYELSGPIQETEETDSGDLVFQNLSFGDYELKVYTVSIDGSRSRPLSLQFNVSPPWYWSVGSRVVYIILLIIMVLGVRRYNRFKLERKQQMLREEMRMEQERRLAQMEKQELAREIRTKQKELASTTMIMARKNKLILELKNLLLLNKEKFTNQQRYRNFMKKLTSAINSEEDWKRFEVNFKELHEDFFETLLDKYPDLTPKDLKLCAYLKMNLTSKEIAPLMGITIRGVEIHRYRLRKKMNLDGGVNISNHLITLR